MIWGPMGKVTGKERLGKRLLIAEVSYDKVDSEWKSLDFIETELVQYSVAIKVVIIIAIINKKFEGRKSRS